VERRSASLATRRAALSASAGVAGFVVAAVAGPSWSEAVLVGWAAAAAVFLVWVWSTLREKDAGATAALAHEEDGSNAAGEPAIVGACVASLVAVAFTLAEAGRAHGGARAAITALAVASVLLAWAAIHTVYTLRYARLYYETPVGGIDFHADDPPDYLDLAYVALTIGMAYQVSDTDLSKRPIRRAAIHHALLSYLFGSVIVAIVINTVASLLGT
jgi:uncharacterized membrane protein